MIRYQITCSHCNRVFQIEVEGGPSVKCSCPYCGTWMIARLHAPVVSVADSPVEGRDRQRRPTGQQPPARRKGGGVVRLLLWSVVLVGLLLGAGYALTRYWEHENARQEAQVMAELRRQAHRDSVMRIRTAEREAEAAAERAEKQQKRLADFLYAFYRDAILGNDAPEDYAGYLTPHCEQLVEGFGWEIFLGDAVAADEDDLRRNLRVEHEEDDWYRVCLVESGMTRYRRVKVVLQDGDMLIDDVR